MNQNDMKTFKKINLNKKIKFLKILLKHKNIKLKYGKIPLPVAF